MSDFADLMPHGGIEPVFDDVYVVQGSVQMKPLVILPRNMTIIRDGTALSLLNAVRLSDEGMTALEALGTVTNIVRVGMHGMDNAWYLDRYPEAKLWAVDGMEHAGGVKTQEVLSADNVPFADGEFFQFKDTKAPEGALLLKRHGGVLLTCDCVQNWESTDGCSFLASIITKVFGFVKPAQIGPPWRKRMTPDGGSLQPDFERMADLPFTHLIGGHGVPLKTHANTRFRETIQRTYSS
ncbi:MAG: hypothetical protein ACI9WU_000333 [Myxococcota bacterium]|jgi:hypothetical protein